MDVEVRFTGVPGIADQTEQRLSPDRADDTDSDAAVLQVPEQDVDGAAGQQHMIAGHVHAVHIRHRLIVQAVEDSDDASGAWCEHRVPKIRQEDGSRGCTPVARRPQRSIRTRSTP